MTKLIENLIVGSNIGIGSYYIALLLGKGSIEKKRFLLGIARITWTPSPHDPNSGNLVLFFRKSKFKIWKSVLNLEYYIYFIIYCIYAT